jgi:hypothetical protein
MTPFVVLSYNATGSSSAAAFRFLIWAFFVVLATVWISGSGQRWPSSISCWRPPWSRPLSPSRLERQILRAVVRFAVLDIRGMHLLPDQVKVVLAPTDMRALGPLADLVAENIAHGMVTLVQNEGYSLVAEPIVRFVALGTQRAGRPDVLVRFGGSATLQAAWPRESVGGAKQGPALLRRVEPPGRPLLLRSNHIRLGRPAECDLAVPEPAVSRRHASVFLRADGWYLLDHGSMNGTFVNGSRIAEPVKLTDGDEIRLGRRVRLRFEHSPLWAA